MRKKYKVKIISMFKNNTFSHRQLYGLFDMLRYDGCLITKINTIENGFELELIQVSKKQPVLARWESFGLELIEVD